MNRLIKRLISIVLSLMIVGTILLQSKPLEAGALQINTVTKDTSAELQIKNAVTLELAENYDTYLASQKGASMPQKEIYIHAENYSACTYKPEIKENFEGKAGKSILTTEDGFIEWSVNIEEPGFYNMAVDYYPISGKSSDIGRSIKIDGKLPYEEARNINFYRVWENILGKNGKAIQHDKRKNDIRPSKQENPMWISKTVRDSAGYIKDPLKFYFSKGSHTIQFASIKEPMLINSFKLFNEAPLPAYAEVKAEYEAMGYKPAVSQLIKFQAEETQLHSDPIIHPVPDRSTPATEPNDPADLRLNALGYVTWQKNGQWVSWEFNVDNEGLYKIGIKAIQSAIGGSFSSRRIYIDGKVPFKELDNIVYKYDTEWKINVLGDKTTPYEFYFTKGKHQIKMEVSLGNMSDILRQVTDITNELNMIYRKILVVTGPIPDVTRDYQFEKIMPDVIEDLKTQSKRLLTQYNAIVSQTDISGENAQILKKVYLQTSEIADKPDTIADRFKAFKINISSLGTWITSTKNQPLVIDYFIIAPTNSKMPKASASFWDSLVFSVRSFFASFYKDYNEISDVEDKRAIKVWIGNGIVGGRDQAQLLKEICDNTFTIKNNINVDLQLVPMGSLLPATLAGIGPDVALTVAMGDPVNYACRHAVVDLTQFSDYSEIAKRFAPSSIAPLQFEKGVYALPETVTYPMLFYRKDIMQELNLSIPQTWDDVIAMLPVLQKKQMNFALPPAAGPTGMSLTAFATLLYQNGGKFYSDDNKKSAIDSRVSIDSFTFLTSLYNDYNIPVVVDFPNRFRTGDNPIGISDFSLYNHLSVFAPELDGIWGFTEVPGVRRADGKIDSSTPNNVNACVILSKSKHQKEAWEFIKWWTDTETQYIFGREIESILGTAARYPTANSEALYRMPWSKADFDSLMLQSKSVVGIPQVPGGYYTFRYLDFAFRDVINSHADPGESISKAAKIINGEIKTKRQEFGLTN